MQNLFKRGESYKKTDIYHILNVPINKQRGEWDKGYRYYEGNLFLFANIGIPGRTGHNYNNYWDGELFFWEATKRSNSEQLGIKKMISPIEGQQNYLFTRLEDRAPFTFEGLIKLKELTNHAPVRIVWELIDEAVANYDYTYKSSPPLLEEGKSFWQTSLRYERNPLARRLCIQHFGAICQICGFDFYKTYGEIGKNYIHVHHIYPISLSNGTKYVLDPEKDLLPVCANCHAMIHKRVPSYDPAELKKVLDEQKAFINPDS